MRIEHQVRGDYLTRGEYPSEEDEPPGIARFLSQGAAVGVLLGFLYPAMGILSNPQNGYNFLFLLALPVFLGSGILFGLAEGTILWAFTFMAGHRLTVVARVSSGIPVLAVLLFASIFLFSDPSPYGERFSTADYVFIIGVAIVYGLLFGLVIGSRFHPLRELLRGTPSSQHPILSALTGIALRVVVIFSLMEAVLYVIWAQEGRSGGDDFTFGVIALTHLIAATVIVFAKLPFSGLLSAALLVNFPIVLLIGGVLTEDGVMRFLAVNYLALWGAFVSTRYGTPEWKADR